MDKNNSNDYDQQLKKLNEKIIHLEKRIESLEKVQKKTAHFKQILKKQNNKITNSKKTNTKLKNKFNFTFNESSIGKYLIGAIASILIVLAALSLISLVWTDFSNLAKFIIIIIFGISLTIIGFIKLKKNSVIYSIVFATGAVIIYIGIVFSYIRWHLFIPPVTLIFISLWSIIFMFSYKFTKSFLITVITSIGSFISIIFIGFNVKTNIDFYILFTYTIIVNTLFLITSKMWLKEKYNFMLSILVFLNIFSFNFMQISSIKISIDFILVISLILITASYVLVCENANKLKSAIISTTITIPFSIMIFLLLNTLINDSKLTFIMCGLILTLIAILIHVKMFNISKITIIPICIFIAINILFICDNYSLPLIGVIFIPLLLLLLDSKKYWYTIICFVILDGIILIVSNKPDFSILYILFVIINIAFWGYILSQSTKHYYFQFYKTYGFLYTLIGILQIAIHIIRHTELIKYNNSIFVFVLVTLYLLIINLSGFFKSWNDKNFKFFKANKNIPYEPSYIVFYTIITFVYFIGIGIFKEITSFSENLIMILTMLILLVFETFRLSNRKFFVKIFSILICLKYTFFVYTILTETFDFKFDYIIISISLLALAFIFIGVGFKIKLNILRFYGLLLTITSVIKIFLLDLTYDNSITRIVSLLIGGILCLGISIIYNKINKIDIK